MMKKRLLTRQVAGAVAGLSLFCVLCSPAQADEEGEIRVGGYLRGYAGWNLDDPQELSGNDRGRLSMLRGQAYIEADSKGPRLQWKIAGRAVREARTDYLSDLQDLERSRGAFANPGFNVTDIYNSAQIREAWVQFQPTENLNVKFGRQQVVWGETDIFQALDVIHGYDNTWAPLLEEPDETRKPLILLNTTLSVPEADGSLQLVIRPGWDEGKYIGSTFDLYGGRGRTAGYKGASSVYGNGFDYHHPEGNKDDVTYALRWKGLAAGVNYHLSYVKAPYTRNVIANSVYAPYVKAPTPTSPTGLLNWIFPTVDVFGTGANGYVQSIDTVLSAELVYTRGEPFNMGSVPSASPNCLGAMGGVADFTSFSGLCGVKRKNTVMTMVRAEKTFQTMDLLSTSGPLSVSAQLFNTRVLGLRDEEDLVQSIGYPNRVKHDTTLGTLVVRAPFNGDKLGTTLALGRDFSNRGTFMALALDQELGAHWRLRAEADLFWSKESDIAMKDVAGVGVIPVGGAAGMPGVLGRNDRFYLRATYQF